VGMDELNRLRRKRAEHSRNMKKPGQDKMF
jgi:hypothetical protein